VGPDDREREREREGKEEARLDRWIKNGRLRLEDTPSGCFKWKRVLLEGAFGEGKTRREREKAAAAGLGCGWARRRAARDKEMGFGPCGKGGERLLAQREKEKKEIGF